ncbi:MAG: Fic family protein [Anaerolineae bacterium]
MRTTWSEIPPEALEKVDRRQEQLDRLRPWSAAAAQRLWDGLLPAWIAGSVAIDGNRMTLDNIAQLLGEGGILPQYTLREHLEVLNHRRVIVQLRRLAGSGRPIRAAVVRRLHATLMAGIDDTIAGRYRRYTTEEERAAGGTTADLMREWELWMAGSAQALHPIERAAVAHHRLLRIQPFLDGNGVTARLVMNLSLLKDGYLPAVLRQEQRHDYRQALFQADQGDYRPLVQLTLEALERVQSMYLLALTP